MADKPSLGQRWAAAQPTKAVLFWCCVASVLATVVVGFGWGGWKTGGSATAMATTAGDKARSELVAALCVDRFRAAGDAAAQLETLRATQSWSRGDFITKGGWAVMPAKIGDSGNGASLCADQLLASAAPAKVTASQ